MNSKLVKSLVLALFLLMTPSMICAGEPFESSRLFTIRSMKQTTKTQKYSFGVDFSIAPLQAVVKTEITRLKQQYPSSAVFIDLAESIDPTVVKAMSLDELKATLLAIPGLSDSERTSINNMTQTDKNVINMLADVLADKEKAITFTLEPYFEWNSDLLSLRFAVPLAGFHGTGHTDFTLGNLYLDAKFTHFFSKSVPIGLLYGVSAYFPTGGQRAVAIGLGYGLSGAKYYYQFLTLAPYVGLGVDLKWVILQSHIEFPQMFKVRGNARSSFMSYFGYGVGIVIAPLKLLNIDIEMAGAANFKNAKMFASHYLSTGVRLNLFGFQLGAAVQFPFVTSKAESYGSLEGLYFGSPAKVNFFTTLGFAY